jgi:aminoglycoside N3'-acetyltransferase
MGVISDTFKTLPGVVTGPGFFRVSAWGRGAEKYSKGLGKLVNENGWALLLGVDIHRLTAMHTQDGNQPEEIKALFEPPADVLADYPPNKWFVETGHPPVDAWGKIQTEADRRGLIRHGKIGECSCMLFRVGEVISIYAEALKKDPLVLYGIG